MNSQYSVKVEAVKHGIPNFVAQDMITTCEKQVKQYLSLCEVMDEKSMAYYAKIHGVKSAVAHLEEMAPKSQVLTAYKQAA